MCCDDDHHDHVEYKDVGMWDNDDININNTVDHEALHFSSPQVLQNPSATQSFDAGFRLQKPDPIKVVKLRFKGDEEEEKVIDSSTESSSLGLTLDKSNSLIEMVERILNQGRRQSKSNSSNSSTAAADHDMKAAIVDDDDGSPPSSAAEKLKAANFPANLLRIGTWVRKSIHEGDLVAKCYFAKKKLVWEILEGALKSKIEMSWDDIIGIRVTMVEDQPGTLEIELKKSPSYFKEINPQPRKHTLWQSTDDFTGGQAEKFRIHYVSLPPGCLDKHYDKFLLKNDQLGSLLQKPFPVLKSPYFEANPYDQPPQFSLNLDFNRYEQELYERRGLQQFPSQIYHQDWIQSIQQQPAALRILDSSSQIPVNGEDDQRTTFRGQRNYIQSSSPPRSVVPYVVPSGTQANLDFPGINVAHPMPYHGVKISNLNMGSVGDVENHHLLSHDHHHNQLSFEEGTVTAAGMSSMYPPQVMPKIDNSNVQDAAALYWYKRPENWGVVMQQVPNHDISTSDSQYPYAFSHGYLDNNDGFLDNNNHEL